MTLPGNANRFSFADALAMTFFRMQLPFNSSIQVLGPDYTSTSYDACGATYSLNLGPATYIPYVGFNPRS